MYVNCQLSSSLSVRNALASGNEVIRTNKNRQFDPLLA
jgi:hypothetical protein